MSKVSQQDLDDEDARAAAEEEADERRRAEPAPALSREEFLAWRSPRTSSSHPTCLDNPLWHWLVRTRWDAYNANNIYSGPSPFDAGPMWCFQRFGKSETPLPDGRVLHIGGEHEDHYDPDFFIYNDVIVIAPGEGIAIHGYPREDFPPTDFHSATLAGDSIFIIGRLGYPDQREVGATPVYKLAVDTLRISALVTTGEPPGWIFKHTATLAGDARTIVVSGGDRWLGQDRPISENIDTWSLDTLTGEWQRLSRRDWQRWTIRRADGTRSRLWDVRQASWHRDHAHLGLDSHWRHKDAPDFEALDMLYRLDKTTPPPAEGPGYNVFSVFIDGLKVRFKEEGFWVEAIVEGRLAPGRLAALQDNMLTSLERIEACACRIDSPEGDGTAP